MKIARLVTSILLTYLVVLPVFSQSSCSRLYGPAKIDDAYWNVPFAVRINNSCTGSNDFRATGDLVNSRYWNMQGDRVKNCTDIDFTKSDWIQMLTKWRQALIDRNNSFRYDSDRDNTKLSEPCRAAYIDGICEAMGPHCKDPNVLQSSSELSRPRDANRNSNQSTQNTNRQSETQQNQSSQQQSQQLQAAAQQVQASARNVQQRADADAQRRGRRMHDPAAEASDCLEVDFTGLYGAMKNKCSYKVHYVFCAYKPRDEKALNSGWLTGLNCENQKFGADFIAPNSAITQHTKGTESIHYFACKDPAWAVDYSFDGGEIRGRCRNVGGN